MVYAVFVKTPSIVTLLCRDEEAIAYDHKSDGIDVKPGLLDRMIFTLSPICPSALAFRRIKRAQDCHTR
jgi:hypothetical protein